MTSSRVLLPVVAVLSVVMVQPPPATARWAGADRGRTELVSVSDSGEQANTLTVAVALNGDGRYAAFVSEADNLVPGDTNLTYDVFVRDRRRGTVERVNVSSAGEQANSGYFGGEHPAFSRNGRFVAFASPASNLVPGDTNDQPDVFVRDRRLGRTTRVSVSSTGGQADGGSYEPVISADGRYVAFSSNAANLVQPATWYDAKVLLHDRQLGTTVLVSASLAGTEANQRAERPSISADGRYVSFWSFATDLVSDGSDATGIFVRDLTTGTTTRASVTDSGTVAVDVGTGSISGTGRYVAFDSYDPNVVAGDTNDSSDVFVRDLQAGTTRRISLSSSGGQGNNFSYTGTVSHSGRYVAFVSDASNLVARDGNDTTDVFLRDLQTGTTRRVSVSRTGVDADSASRPAQISADGRHVAFLSDATNLVRGDTNDYADAFVWSAP